MTVTVSNNPPSDLVGIRRYLQTLVSQIKTPPTRTNVQGIQFVVQNVEPSKPRRGLLVYADGTDWNPGSGEGLYRYDGTTWNYIG